MHFWKSDEKWHYVSQEGYNKMEESKELPPICFVTKNYIQNIESKEWPSLDPKELLIEDAKDSKVIYLAHNTDGEKKIEPMPESNEPDIFSPETTDINPLIYYRLSKPLKEDATLPDLDLTKYFEKTEAFGLKVTMSPDYTYFINDEITKTNQNKYSKTLKSIKNFEERFDKDLFEAIEKYISSSGIDIVNDKKSKISVSDCKLSIPELKDMPKDKLQARINAYVEFNRQFAKTIPFVILKDKIVTDLNNSNCKLETISSLFMQCKNLAFRVIKFNYINNIANMLNEENLETRVKYNRSQIQLRKDAGDVDEKGEWTTFGTTMQALKSEKYKSLKINNSDSKAWDAKFLGEGSQDAGGPYREALTVMISELYTPCLPLLIPTQNNKNDHGHGRDLWTINPAWTTPSQLEMYKFLGALMGLAFRAGHVIDIKFPSIIWKLLLGESITLEDLELSDAYVVQAIKNLRDTKAQTTPDMFDMAMEDTFTTLLSNGETVPVCPDGEDKKVTWESLEQYITLVVQTRENEGKRQMDSLKEGFNLIFPINEISLLSWQDVEERVRGPSEISIDALKSIAEYENCNKDNQYIKRFWRILEEFENHQRALFLKFVWGRDRLPSSDKLKDKEFRIVLFDSDRAQDHNTIFPEAHTCFFQLDLPRYKTDEAAKSKILYAIEACGSIDTDHDAGDDEDDDY